jgi:parallel beta-helix repeat protein
MKEQRESAIVRRLGLPGLATLVAAAACGPLPGTGDAGMTSDAHKADHARAATPDAPKAVGGAGAATFDARKADDTGAARIDARKPVDAGPPTVDAGAVPSVVRDDCPTTAAPVTADPGDDTPYTWPTNPRCGATNVSWSDSDQAIVVDGLVDCTLTELAALDHDHAPVLVDLGADPTASGATWFARYGVLMRNGAVLFLHGSARGGDVDELRLRSDPGPVLPDFTLADPKVAASVRVDWGGLDIDGVHVISWDTTKNGPDVDPHDGRAFIATRSEYRGGQAYESRMDIRRSDISYLGYHAPESYSVAWRVVDGDSIGLKVFDLANVYGDVEDSHFHDNYFGGYTFGAYGMRVRRNEFDHNAVYGFDPHDDSDALIVEDNQFHDNGKHGFICSKRCDHLQVRRNVSKNNAVHGIMLHASATDWIVEDNDVTGNGSGGITLFESGNNIVRGNRLAGNKFGILLLSGSSDNVIEGNEIDDSTSYSIYAYIEDPPIPGGGRSSRNEVRGNVISQGGSNPIKLDQADDNVFEGNRISDFPKGVVVTNATGNRFVNTCIAGGLGLASAGPATPTTISVDEASVTASLDLASTMSGEDPDGALFAVPDGTPTTLTPTGSSLAVAGPSGKGGATITRLPVTVLPDVGNATAQLLTWSAREVSFSISPSAVGQNFAVSVTSLPAGSSFEVSRGSLGETLSMGHVDDGGVARFSVTCMDVAAFSFLVKLQ